MDRRAAKLIRAASAAGHGTTAGSERSHALETTKCGVFAIGDVRAKSAKRVAAAVGEGAQVVAVLQTYLASAGATVR